MLIDLYGLPCDGSLNLLYCNRFQIFLIFHCLKFYYEQDSVSDVERAELKSMLACIGGALLDTCS